MTIAECSARAIAVAKDRMIALHGRAPINVAHCEDVIIELAERVIATNARNLGE